MQARAARRNLLAKLEALEPPLDREAISALLGRESLGTAAIEGELLDPGQVRSSVARRLQLPLAEGQPTASAQMEGLLDVLLEATTTLDAPLTQALLNHWHQRLFAAGPDGLHAIRIGALRGEAPMQVLSGAIADRLLAEDCRPQASQVLFGRALGISAQILREREGYYTALERCQRGDLDVTPWQSWFLEQLTAAAEGNGAVIDAVQRKAAFWWSHRHSGFNNRQQKLLNRLLDAEPEGFTGGMSLRKAISLTKVSRAYRIHWPSEP